MKVRFVALALALACTIYGGIARAVTAPPAISQQAIVEAVQEGKQAYLARDYATAEAKYERAVELTKAAAPKMRIIILSNLAAVYREDHKYDRAEATFKRALDVVQVAGLESDPSAKLLMQQYAVLLRKLNRTMEADALEIRAMSTGGAALSASGPKVASKPAGHKAPSSVAAQMSAAVSKISVDAAEGMTAAELRKELDKDPGNEMLWAALGMKHYEAENFKDAAFAFKHWLDLTKTKEEQARHAYVVCLLKTAQAETALEHCKKLVATNPEEGNYYRLLSACYAQLGDTTSQLQIDEQFVEKFPNHQEFTRVSQALPYLRRDIEQTGKAPVAGNNKPSDDELDSSFIKAKMPLKVFIKPSEEPIVLAEDNSGITDNVPDSIIQHAMEEWAQASQGRISFVMANTLEEAQITVEYVDSPNGLENDFALGITGWSDANPANIQRTIKLLVVNRDTNKSLERSRFYEAALHEFGHAVGLQHSASTTDIMYRKARIQPIMQLSDNDKDRLVKLYTAL